MVPGMRTHARPSTDTQTTTTAAKSPSAQFDRDGYLVVRDALPERVLAPIRALIDRNVDAHARDLRRKGEIEDLHEEQPFERRLALLYRDHESRMRSWNNFLFSPELYDLVHHGPILDAMEPLLGPEISFNGDYHLRPKLPSSALTAFPMHQDSQYYGPQTGHILVITVWIPLVDVDQENGCLWVIPGSHRWGLLAGARRADDNMVSFEDVERRGTPIPIPMRCGDFLAFHNLTFHGSKVNRTDGVRWSLDVRFRETPGYRRIGDQEATGNAHLEAALMRSAKPPLVVRSRRAENLGDYAGWEELRSRLLQTRSAS